LLACWLRTDKGRVGYDLVKSSLVGRKCRLRGGCQKTVHSESCVQARQTHLINVGPLPRAGSIDLAKVSPFRHLRTSDGGVQWFTF
jgi:hypothetical protein